MNWIDKRRLHSSLIRWKRFSIKISLSNGFQVLESRILFDLISLWIIDITLESKVWISSTIQIRIFSTSRWAIQFVKLALRSFRIFIIKYNFFFFKKTKIPWTNKMIHRDLTLVIPIGVKANTIIIKKSQSHSFNQIQYEL